MISLKYIEKNTVKSRKNNISDLNIKYYIKPDGRLNTGLDFL